MPYFFTKTMNQMKYDVLVAGGGPAGLSAAFTAAKSGAKVAVFEKSKEIGYPVHTSGGSWIDELRKLDIPDRFMHPIQEGVFISPKEQAAFRFETPPSCILDIRGLYQYLAEIASAEGTEIIVDSTVVEPHYKTNKISGLKVRKKAGEYLFEAPLVIDASGAASVIARKVGLSNGFSKLGIGAEYDLFAPHWPQNKVAFLFGNQVAPGGYAWIFPHPDHRIRLGVGVVNSENKIDPRRYLDKLLKDASLFKHELSQVSQIEYHTGLIPGEIYLKKTATDGVLVVGDAGGLVSTLLGEGIRFAIDIGRMAGEVAGEAVQKKRFEARFLSKYEALWKKKYKRIFQIGELINKRLVSYSDEQWDARIKVLAKLDSALIPNLLKGEYSLKLLLRLSHSVPGFFRKTASTALKSILKNT